jgi:hypothetical protein
MIIKKAAAICAVVSVLGCQPIAEMDGGGPPKPFSKVDTDGDLNISQDEAEDANLNRLAKNWKKADQDKDSVLAESEYKAFFKGKKWEQTFTEVDLDNDDNLSKYEAEKTGASKLVKNWKSADKDGDTVVSEKEFEAFKSKPVSKHGKNRLFIFADGSGHLHSAKTSKTGNKGAIHVFGSLGVSNADFFRGAFDGIPEGTDELSVPSTLAAIIEIVPEGDGMLSEVSLAFGAHNALSIGEPPGLPAGQEHREHWYESDHFASVSAKVAKHWLTALTYAVYASPADLAATTQEIIWSAGYTGKGLVGKLKPEFQLASKVKGGDGIFTRLVVAPKVKVLKHDRYPVTLKVPAAVGVGTNDYYGRAVDTGAYASVGLDASVPLAFVPSDHGAWKLTTKVDFTYRTDDIIEAEPPYAEGEQAVVDAAILLEFLY